MSSFAAYLQELHNTSSWHFAGTHWRNRFLLEGELYRRKESGAVFRVLGSQGGAVLVWIMQPATDNKGCEIQDCWTASPRHPIWQTLLAWGDYSAIPTKACSPLGTYALGLTPKSLQAGIVLWQTGPELAVLQHAARQCFKGQRDEDLKKLAVELNLETRGLHCCICTQLQNVFLKCTVRRGSCLECQD